MINIWLVMDSNEDLMEDRNAICTNLSCSFRGSHVPHIKNLVLVVKEPNSYPLSVTKSKTKDCIQILRSYHSIKIVIIIDSFLMPVICQVLS